MKDQVREESTQPTTFEIPADALPEVLRVREQYEAAIDLANAKMKTLRRTLNREADAFAEQLQKRADELAAQLEPELKEKGEALQRLLATFVPVDLEKQRLVFVGLRELTIRDRCENIGERNPKGAQVANFLKAIFAAGDDD